MKPPVPITDPAFCYTPSHSTDIRVRFAQVAKDRREAEAAREAEAKATHARAFPLAREQKRRQA